MTKINSSPESETLAPVIARQPSGDSLGREMATAVISFHETVARKLGMSAAESRTLTSLNALGLATPGQLAQATGLTTGAITGIIDRLEKAGYARREPNPNDRRSLLIRPLQQDKLGQIIGPIFGSLSAAMTEMASHYTPEQLAVIGRYLADTTAVLRAETARLKGR